MEKETRDITDTPIVGPIVEELIKKLYRFFEELVVAILVIWFLYYAIKKMIRLTGLRLPFLGETKEKGK